MAITTTMAEGIERAERTLALWHRVCAELEEGKAWEAVDNGMIPEAQGKVSLTAWTGYMQQKMYHDLQELVWIYRDGLEVDSHNPTEST